MSKDFARMHNDYLDPDRYYNKSDDEERYANAVDNSKALLEPLGCKTWGNFYKAVYKGTACGPTIAVRFFDSDVAYYNDELYKFAADKPALKISVSSIVEGSDVEVPAIHVDMTEEDAHKTFWNIVETVNRQATELWDEANGGE